MSLSRWMTIAGIASLPDDIADELPPLRPYATQQNRIAKQMAKASRIRSTSRSISLSPEHLQAFQAASYADELSISEWIGLAAMQQLPPDVRMMLPTRPTAGRPPTESEK